MTRHFLSLADLNAQELHGIIDRAIELKRMLSADEHYEPLRNKTLAMVFEKSSTRTRVSFETAMTHFGGNAIFLNPRDSHLGRGEPIEDTARVLSGMVNGIVLRTISHTTIETFAQYAMVPVINGLSDRFHPCQLLADVLTYVEHRGDISGKKVAWIGDGNNMCHSWINAVKPFDFQLAIATPPGFEPSNDLTDANVENVSLTHDIQEAATDSDIILTDTWASMGQEQEKADREQVFLPFQVNTELMAYAKPDAVFMHCLPAYRGYEVTADVIDGPQSIVWDQAANRLHAQKALIDFLMVSN
ncbi:MAG: ornithine carbamoyltransferase [Gammaproteobacteria bacterium]|nr:ornithine carbamoyltransferase [Gammaproteobacteria bacterium]